MELIWDEIYENERNILGKGWLKAPQLQIDPPQFTDKRYRLVSEPKSFLLPNNDYQYTNENNNNINNINNNKIDNNNWIWADKWKHSNWYYAISFGATLNMGFKWSNKKTKLHCVRQRVWRRPRIRIKNIIFQSMSIS